MAARTHATKNALSALGVLYEAWKVAFPGRAFGGQSALLGFSDQFDALLYALVQASLRGSSHGEPPAFTELVSDIVVANAAGLIVVQVKRTQSSGAVRKALQELWEIYLLTRRKKLGVQVTFRILSVQEELADAGRAIQRWKPKGPCGPRTLRDFKKRVTASVEHSLRDRLTELVANRLGPDSTDRQLQTWRGLLLDAAQGGTFESASRAIWIDLGDLKRRARSGNAYLWTARDRQPAAVTRGEILGGRPASVTDLRNGCFAPREGLLRALTERAARWTTNHRTAGSDTRCPCFWIEGLPGVGKSVLLLQLLGELHALGHKPLLWVEDVSQIQGVLATRGRSGDGAQPIIGLDDPYPPGAGEQTGLWKAALATLGPARYSGAPLPLFIVCGPTEQAAGFERELRKFVSLEHFPLPSVVSDEFEALRTWFEARTGWRPPALPRPDARLVGIFFEWGKREPLAAFALRLQGRIAGADPGGALTARFARLLALNRLDVKYPADALKDGLSEQQRKACEELRDEVYLDQTGFAGGGIQLAHQQLADEIYEHWYPAERAGDARRDHLVGAILDCLRSGGSARERTAPLEAVLRALGGRASDQLAHDDLPGALGRVYDALTQSPGGVPFELALYWLRFQRLLPGLVLSPEPVAWARALLGTHLQEENWAAVWSDLQAHDSEREELLECARQWLRIGAAHDADWARVWRVLWARGSDDMLLGQALDWLAKPGRLDEAWRGVWMAVRRSAPADPRIPGLAESWLAATSDDPNWQFIWGEVGTGNPARRKLGEDWLARVSPHHPGWKWVWIRLWKATPGDATLVSRARAWLQELSEPALRAEVEEALESVPRAPSSS